MPEPAPHSFRVQGPEPPPRGEGAPAEAVYEITVANSRELDRRARDDYAIPTLLLMENAALGLAAHAAAMLKHARERSVLILCGPGNNGGDGFALARHLHNRRLPLTVVTTHPHEHYAGDARTNLDIIIKMKPPIVSAVSLLDAPPESPPALIVDALLGTGLDRPIEGHIARLIAWVNQTRAAHEGAVRVLAADIPSGLSGSTGEPLGQAVITADRTVTFAAIKPGLSAVHAQPYLGETHVAPIGAPVELLEELATRLQAPQDRHTP